MVYVWKQHITFTSLLLIRTAPWLPQTAETGNCGPATRPRKKGVFGERRVVSAIFLTWGTESFQTQLCPVIRVGLQKA